VPAGYLEYGKLYRWWWMAWDANGGYSTWSTKGWFWCYSTAQATPNYTDGGSPVSWELVIGPLMFQSQKDKQLVRLDLVLSLGAGATATVQTAANESGAYSASLSLSAGSEATVIRQPLPLNAGDLVRGKVFRVRLTGTGYVRIMDVIPVYRVRRQ
jgi:hypothetical protein